MAYTGDMNWAAWSGLVTSNTNNFKQALQSLYNQWEKFYAMTYGLTDAQILLLPAFSGRSQSDLDSMRSNVNTGKQIYDGYYGNAALAQYNYNGYMIAFEC